MGFCIDEIYHSSHIFVVTVGICPPVCASVTWYMWHCYYCCYYFLSPTFYKANFHDIGGIDLKFILFSLFAFKK